MNFLFMFVYLEKEMNSKPCICPYHELVIMTDGSEESGYQSYNKFTSNLPLEKCRSLSFFMAFCAHHLTFFSYPLHLRKIKNKTQTLQRYVTIGRRHIPRERAVSENAVRRRYLARAGICCKL